MKKFIAAACAAAICLSGCSAVKSDSGLQRTAEYNESLAPESCGTKYVPMNFREQVGVWLPYVKFPEIMQGKNADGFRKALGEFLEDAAADNVNTLYFHVHPMGDSYYSSEIYPTGVYLDGGFDALGIVLDEAHKRGISVHAWINPLRMQTDEVMRTLPDDYIIKRWINDGEPYVKNVNGRWYLDPAYEESVELMTRTVSEILDNYRVDGLQIDDYFYPTTDPEFDREAFEASGCTDLAEWRTGNVDRFVKAIYDTVKSRDERLVFGISPQGNIRVDYDTQYADVRLWGGEKGYCDYIVPQIYYGFENVNSPFLPTLDEWVELVGDSGVSLIIGLAAYKLGREDKWAGEAAELEWINDPDIIRKQIEAVKKSAADGYALY
ncbi:MAG: family 10 glycosylhydrolase [Ruminococcus sp.]|uniref:glycoside hydrolase family 10 protein n=1 Tax=Ruminococcus sp. TaxID=41978 RepID=UPI0025D0FCFD|nr:family 10 glycosylhydrolase [Ruminococcus sp.]MCR5600847.1 family 10 glycosylhydrolase [Ruminococcus sp.]